MQIKQKIKYLINELIRIRLVQSKKYIFAFEILIIGQFTFISHTHYTLVKNTDTEGLKIKKERYYYTLSN